MRMAVKCSGHSINITHNEQVLTTESQEKVNLHVHLVFTMRYLNRSLQASPLLPVQQ